MAMAIALVFNPGSNSLKFDLVELAADQPIASHATKLASAALDGIGRDTTLSVYRGREIIAENRIEAKDMTAAAHAAFGWLRAQKDLSGHLGKLALAGVRVVHGGSGFEGATKVTAPVRKAIAALEELAPLHNQSSLDILDVLSKELPDIAAYVTFDTAFHRTLPEKAWRYPIERETADRHGVRKFGFHGLSHRYMLEQFAHMTNKAVEDVTIVTLHLESGCSACAIERGRSVDTTMGLTPLEGLMMGSRSGSIDPAIVPFLMRKEAKSAEDILSLLNKHSGLLGIAGGTLDTRELVKRDDAPAHL
ncbi:MAG: acetate/propionate family kinase, partial [Janthinobacterium lividum]